MRSEPEPPKMRSASDWPKSVSAPAPPSTRSAPAPEYTTSLWGPASTRSAPGPPITRSTPSPPSTSSSPLPPSPYIWSGGGVLASCSPDSVPTRVSATATAPSRLRNPTAATSTEAVRLMDTYKQAIRRRVAALGGFRLVVALLAGQHDLRHAVAHEHPRLHRNDLARARHVERVGDRLGLGQRLEVLDRGEYEHQLVAGEGLERGGGTEPARVDALDDVRAMREVDAGLLLQLANGRGRVAGVLGVHGAAREDPGAAHKALLRIALDEEHLRAVQRVAQDDDRGGLTRLGHLTLVELLAGMGPVDPHLGSLTLTFLRSMGETVTAQLWM